jgi:hypothetical protein
MSLIDKIPMLTDAEVFNLLENAHRLGATGDERQRAAAADILPALETAAAGRRSDLLARAQARRAATRGAKRAA